MYQKLVLLISILSIGFSASAQQKIYELFENYPELGGVLVAFNKDTNKGLILTANDLSQALSWDDASKLDSKTLAYDQNAIQFSDWRLPEIEELNVLFSNKEQLGLKATYYWSASHSDDGGAWEQNFGNGRKAYVAKRVYNVVRTVREVTFDTVDDLVLTEG